ncbi:Integrase core domain protein [Paraliobacillus sp. PM-2]|uniref:IS21 family transposase n=1 Tax=Paraliobacillus sp. PM-2 TaxID=1462524 RepID=UPI00061CD39E|nr:IS21 family transposase [Paraliobacillus sp. PM-2]CQR46599.1 Integrase core domain protein [Paraliobacillus sp. PM-2]
MITLKKKQKVLKRHLNGESQRSIARTTKVSRNTVRKYIAEFENSKQKDVRQLPIPESIVSKPTYKPRVSKKRVLTEEIQKRLQQFIAENQWKQQHYMAKQKMKMIDMYETLRDEGYNISYTTVRNYVNKENEKQKEVFIRKYCEPGAEIEFDWGEVKLEIDGRLKSYSLAVFTLPFSNYRFARLYESETQVCVLDVHTKMINHLGFIPTVFTYDNMRTVVRSFIGNEKTITEPMEQLSNYYQFRIRLCEAKKGNEKGHVERSVEFIRRKVFASMYKFDRLVEANQHLIKGIHKLNHRLHHEHKEKHIDLMKKEKEVAGVTEIHPFDSADLIECRVDKYSTVVIKHNHYSVPEGHVGKYIRAKVGAENIRLFIDGEHVATHPRNWGIHQWEMDIYHYLATFEKKKGALIQSQSLKQAPTHIKNIYHTYYIGKEKEFIALLHYIKENDNLHDVLAAIQQLKNIRSDYISTERIQFICEQDKAVHMIVEDDDIAKQAQSNLRAYHELFYKMEKGVM